MKTRLDVQNVGEIRLRRRVKISEETYHRLNRFTDELSDREGRPRSMESAVLRLLDERENASPLDFTGVWEMDDQEAEEILRTLKDIGSTWRTG